MKTNKLITQIITVILVLSAASCRQAKQPETETAKGEVLPDDIVEVRYDQAKLANIQTGGIELRSLSGMLKVNGIVTVAPQNYATVCMPMGGFVKSVALTSGSAVKKGQVLSTLESQDYIDLQQNYLEARNKLDFAEADYKRHAELYKDEVYSQQNIQQVTTDFKNLKAQVRGYEQKLSLIGINPSALTEDNINRSVSLISPINGYVQSVHVSVGKSVSASDILFEIVNNDNLLLELTLFEKDADKVSPGQKIRFFINNETEEHEAFIEQTGKSIQTDKSYKVYAKVKGVCKNLMPGMYVNAIIESSGNQVYALPNDAIVSFDDKDYIFIFEKDKTENGKAFTEYRMVEITKGVTDDGFTEIQLPIGLDQKSLKVVLKGAYNLLSAKKNAGEMSC
jgi:membrane fusion protein, heavy metal efflux system